MVNSVITGAASGIGLAVREQLEAQGDRVVGIDLQGVEINVDLSTPEGRQTALARTLELTNGAVDRLVLAAGLGGVGHDPVRVITVNYFGVFDVLDGLKDSMVGRPGAAAVAICSNASQFGVNPEDPVVLALLDHDEAKARELMDDSDGGMAYALSKYALARAVRRRAPEWGEAGVRLNAIVPGKTETPLYQYVLDHPETKELADLIPVPLGRTATPQEIARIIVFMLSDAAAYIHGSLVWADGGTDAAIRPDSF